MVCWLNKNNNDNVSHRKLFILELFLCLINIIFLTQGLKLSKQKGLLETILITYFLFGKVRDTFSDFFEG